jgi:hypothetical protein
MHGIMKSGAWNAAGRKHPKKGFSIRFTSEGTASLNGMGHGKFPVPLKKGGTLHLQCVCSSKEDEQTIWLESCHLAATVGSVKKIFWKE